MVYLSQKWKHPNNNNPDRCPTVLFATKTKASPGIISDTAYDTKCFRGFLLANMIKYAEGCRFFTLTKETSKGQRHSSRSGSQIIFSFLNKAINVCAIFFCSWFKSWFQILGPRDNTANFVWFDRILPSTKLLWLNPVEY